MSTRGAVLGLGAAGSEAARDLVAAGADVRGCDPGGRGGGRGGAGTPEP